MKYTVTALWPNGTDRTVTGIEQAAVEPLTGILEGCGATVTATEETECSSCPRPATVQTPEGMPYCSQECYAGLA